MQQDEQKYSKKLNFWRISLDHAVVLLAELHVSISTSKTSTSVSEMQYQLLVFIQGVVQLLKTQSKPDSMFLMGETWRKTQTPNGTFSHAVRFTYEVD